MPSKDTINTSITKKTVSEINKVRSRIARDLRVPEKDVTFKQAEIAFRIKAKRGNLLLRELQDILLGKVK